MFVSGETLNFVETHINLWVFLALSTIGILVNSTHLSVSLRMQKLHGSFSIPISTLCFWNLVRCLSVFVHRLYGPIGMFSRQYGVSWRNMSGPYLDYFETSSANVTCTLTAYVALTRCLCVAMPFTVKSIFTPKFTTVMMVSISAVVFAAYFVMYFSFVVKLEFSEEFNTTIPRYEYSDLYLSHGDLLNRYYVTLSVILPSLSLCIICIGSVVTWYYLKRSTNAAVLKYTSQLNSQPKMSQREKGVAKMLLVLFIFFILTTVPRLFFHVAQLAEEEFFVYKKYHNLYLLLFRLLMGLDLLSCCTIFFVSLVIRSSFRAMVKCSFCS